MGCVVRKLVVYSSADQSTYEVAKAVSTFFKHTDCFYNPSHITNQFEELAADIASREFSKLKAAIQTCQSENSGLLIVRDIERKRYLEALKLLRDSELRNIMTVGGELTCELIENAIKSEVRKRQRISEGTKKGLARAKEAGKVLGNPSFMKIRNFDTTAANIGKQDQAYMDALKLIAEVDQLPPSEKYSYSKIANVLNLRGITTRRGKPINRGTIRRAYIRVKEHN